jgi:hypothetical protein
MPEENTTAIVQQYLDELTGEAPAEPVVRLLLDRASLRLQRFYATLLHHDYPRLTRPPRAAEAIWCDHGLPRRRGDEAGRVCFCPRRGTSWMQQWRFPNARSLSTGPRVENSTHTSSSLGAWRGEAEGEGGPGTEGREGAGGCGILLNGRPTSPAA